MVYGRFRFSDGRLVFENLRPCAHTSLKQGNNYDEKACRLYGHFRDGRVF